MRVLTVTSEEDLARRAGSPVEVVRRVRALGILPRGDPGHPFRPSDVALVRFAEAYERAGVPLEAIARALAAGDFTIEWIEAQFPDPPIYTGKTYAQTAAELGVPCSFLEQAMAAAGLPRPGPEDNVREDDLDLLVVPVALRGLGFGDEAAVGVCRIFGESLRRIASAAMQWAGTHVVTPAAESGVGASEFVARTTEAAVALLPLADRFVEALYRRHMDRELMRINLEDSEIALEKAGVWERRPKGHPAIAFIDLSGYSKLTEERGDESAARVAAALAELVRIASESHGGQTVKMLADGVMFHFPEPAAAVVCGLDLVDRAEEEGLPPARFGVNAGPVVYQDGDYFGRTVNVASRVTDYARPREVLVTAGVVAVCADDRIRFETIGPVSLRGVPQRVELFRAARR